MFFFNSAVCENSQLDYVAMKITWLLKLYPLYITFQLVSRKKGQNLIFRGHLCMAANIWKYIFWNVTRWIKCASSYSGITTVMIWTRILSRENGSRYIKLELSNGLGKKKLLNWKHTRAIKSWGFVTQICNIIIFWWRSSNKMTSSLAGLSCRLFFSTLFQNRLKILCINIFYSQILFRSFEKK